MTTATAAQHQVGDGRAPRQFLTFLLGDGLYGLDILRVQEIRGWEPTRDVPDGPEAVQGLLDLRGVIVPVVDLRKRFGLPVTQGRTTTVIIVRLGDDESADIVGLVVDGVSDVVEAKPGDVRPLQGIGAAVSGHYIMGALNAGGQLILVLDAGRLLTAEGLVSESGVKGEADGEC